MKVALVSNTDWYIFNFRLSLVEQLLADGSEVLLVSPPGPYGLKLLEKGYDWRPVQMSRTGVGVFGEIRSVFRLSRMLNAEKVDVVHAFTIKAAILSAIASRLARVPGRVSSVAGLGYVFTSRDLFARVLRPLVKVLMRTTLSGANARIILQNADDVEFFREHAIARASQIRLIRSSGVDTERFSPPEKGRGSDPLRVLLPARLLFDKGLAEFVAAAELVLASGRRMDFLVAGDLDPGNPSSVPTTTLAKWKASGSVTWLGHVEDVASLMKSVDVVALPSYREGLPKGLIEGGAAGCVLVTTDVEGCREVVTNEVDGLLVPARDAVSLANAFIRLHDEPMLRDRLSAASRRKIMDSFDHRSVNSRTISVYREFFGV